MNKRENRIVADLLSERIFQTPAFDILFSGLELAIAHRFLSVENDASGTISHDGLLTLLRYADIMSHSSESHFREISYNIVALLREYDELIGFEETSQSRVNSHSEAILAQLGNFPGLKTLEKFSARAYTMPVSRAIARTAKEIIQETHQGGAILTDTQFAIVDRLRSTDYFSFSGPTSLGKSFILKDALYDILGRTELDDHCVVILVPTKALIGQTAEDLRKLLLDVPDVNVLTYPSMPLLLRRRFRRTVFVLTPERLLRYLANPVREIDYLIVDEAQKVVAADDARSALYYHSILETTRRFATKLIFSSPSIKNPEIFLELFQKSSVGAMGVVERTVAQQRYFIDLVDNEMLFYSSLGSNPVSVGIPPAGTDAIEFILAASSNRKSIVYVNSSADAAVVAMELAGRRGESSQGTRRSSRSLRMLSTFVREYVHPDYYLGSSVLAGVAFHHGKMPQDVRERVEAEFSDPESELQFVVSTSTLLEGVNLPAKNIFVLADRHGPRTLSKIDFENLAGRAGRLTYDFSGNVVCVRGTASRWKGSSRALIPRGEPSLAESFLVNPGAKRKKYDDIARVLRGESLPSGRSADALRSARQYASVLTLHEIDGQYTRLRDYFIQKIGNGRDLLRKASVEIEMPSDVLRLSPDILPKYQNAVWRGLGAGELGALVPEGAPLDRTETFKSILELLSDVYGWREEEVGGTDPLLPHTSNADSISSRLTYWAILMRSWVRGDPINRVIGSSIAYHRRVGTIETKDYSSTEIWHTEAFNATNPRHVNLVIEETLKDLEGGLRFKIIAYLQNYYELSLYVLGPVASGLSVAALVEYGTSDQRAIELQEIGLSRTVAADLLARFPEHLGFGPGGDLSEIDEAAILRQLDAADPLRIELESVLGRNRSL
jgi:superfamily II DNA or RNA helicase